MRIGFSPAFVDLPFLLVVLFLLLPHQPASAEDEDSNAGDLVIEISWCDNCYTDVDLWVIPPGDRPIGFSRLRGKDCSLFRDDLGDEKVSYRLETLACRSIPDGEYIVNVHLWGDAGGNRPIEVSVEAWYRKPKSNPVIIWEGSVVLKKMKQEMTVVRFSMRDGDFMPGSVHMSPKKILGQWETGVGNE